MTKPGSFYIGFVHLYKQQLETNPVLKRSGIVMNPEQFPAV